VVLVDFFVSVPRLVKPLNSCVDADCALVSKLTPVIVQVFRTQAVFSHVMKACRSYIERHRAALVTVSFAMLFFMILGFCHFLSVSVHVITFVPACEHSNACRVLADISAIHWRWVRKVKAAGVFTYML